MSRRKALAALALACTAVVSRGFIVPAVGKHASVALATQAPTSTLGLERGAVWTAASFPDAVKAAAADIVEDKARALIETMQSVLVSVPELSETPISTNFVRFGAKKKAWARSAAPIVLCLHGFDSSLLEFRRLLPALAADGIESVAVDILRSGFTDLTAASECSAAAKVAHLRAFWEQTLDKRPVVLLGASLGGALAVDLFVSCFKVKHPNAVKGLVLLDAQVFIDGTGPGKWLPKPLARLGVKFLGTVGLRRAANDLAYFDRALATDDAINIGRLHVLQQGWEEANMAYMASGGFSVSGELSSVTAPTIILWGREDKILPPAENNPEKLLSILPDAEFRYIEECGHVPHLEKPQETADLIKAFMKRL